MAPSLVDEDGLARQVNGYTNGVAKQQRTLANCAEGSPLPSTDADEMHDLVCIGFGPASLAIAVALHDALVRSPTRPQKGTIRNQKPKVAFIERQPNFAWHEGMLLPDAKMQITFVKDMATLRDPQSEFTFLNYLHQQNRLVQFTNLGTFYPLRAEYERYMRWCADKFSHVVHYGEEGLRVEPGAQTSKGQRLNSFTVFSREVESGRETRRQTRHVVVAVGGKPAIPQCLHPGNSRVIHSSSYLKEVPRLLQNTDGRYNIAVIGCGQSAAEVFNDLHTRYPNSSTSLVIRGTALRPSDDSPFVNEVFDPWRVDDFYEQPAEVRAAVISSNRATNYGVVRLDLLDHLYAKMYQQEMSNPDKKDWQHRILTERTVLGLDRTPGEKSVRLKLLHRRNGAEKEHLDVDLVVVATGYARDGHEDVLRSARHLMDGEDQPQKRWKVQRDYRVRLDPRKVDQSAGIWLQGCNEDTHGLGDTLLSLLAVRAGEVVDSIFGGVHLSNEPDEYANGLTNGYHGELD